MLSDLRYPELKDGFCTIFTSDGHTIIDLSGVVKITIRPESWELTYDGGQLMERIHDIGNPKIAQEVLDDWARVRRLRYEAR